MEHVARRLVQKMVLHLRRAEHDHAVRRGLHSGEEDELVREARAPRTDPRNIWNDPVEKLDGPSVVGSFISRRVQPCQRRVHPGYEYQGNTDPTRMRQRALDKIEVKARIGELFNLADPNYARLSDIEHAFKLAQPPPKVTHLAWYP